MEGRTNFKKKIKEEPKVLPGVGLDVGTSFLISSRKESSGNVLTKRMRDAFLEIDPDDKKYLKVNNIDVVEIGKSHFIIGEESINIAKIFKKEASRPMQAGVLNPNLKGFARKIIKEMIRNLLGEPLIEKEICYYSVPAAPVDRDSNLIYHQGLLGSILKELGYQPIAANEAQAIVYSDCYKDDYSAISLSFGGGMVNCCMTYKLMGNITFATTRSGDWIDERSASAIGSTASRLIKIKENKKFNLTDDPYDLDIDNGDAMESIQYHYKSMILYTIDNIVKKFKEHRDQLEFPEEVPIVIGGGTSLAKGFIKLFKEGLAEINVPIDIKEVRHAEDPINAVSKGLLIQALSHEE